MAGNGRKDPCSSDQDCASQGQKEWSPIITGRILRIASLKDEYDIGLLEPNATIRTLKTREYGRIDVFTFIQKIPDTVPTLDFPIEWESLAVLEYKDHKYWFEKILDDKTRNMIRKAGKKGVAITRARFDDPFVRGIMEIYNETPVRQGRPFKHFGKTFDETKAANATHLERSEFIGAYLGPELIGFVKVAFGEKTARAEQIISKVAHRDKAPTNALLDETVKLCEERKIPYLIYGTWPAKETFAQFKKNNGFVEYRLPRYYVPLTRRGAIAVKLKWYKGLKGLVPGRMREAFMALRERWYSGKPNRG